MLELLELNKVPCNLIFKGEIKLLEFTEMIGDMNINICVNPIERDKKLLEIGKKNFKEKIIIRKIINDTTEVLSKLLSQINIGYTSQKSRRNSKTIFREIISNETDVLSQEEIDKLLTPINAEPDKNN
ncbi:hypothetical protein AGMMS49960_20440 [Betaproteobacteria bacterium]|nr:hypothetical protein AGMMS49960_20440 [Betaproteobacteria bacterium]